MNQTIARRLLGIIGAGSLAVLAGCLPVEPPPPPPPPPPTAQSMTFTCTGAAQSFMVPAGVTSVTVDALGAGGGAGAGPHGSSGGRGGQATATIPVTPGESLQINVGCHGGAGGSPADENGGAGGFNAGLAGDGDGGSGPIAGYLGGGGGGGASDVRRGGTALIDRVVVAGLPAPLATADQEREAEVAEARPPVGRLPDQGPRALRATWGAPASAVRILRASARAAGAAAGTTAGPAVTSVATSARAAAGGRASGPGGRSSEPA